MRAHMCALFICVLVHEFECVHAHLPCSSVYSYMYGCDTPNHLPCSSVYAYMYGCDTYMHGCDTPN